MPTGWLQRKGRRNVAEKWLSNGVQATASLESTDSFEPYKWMQRRRGRSLSRTIPLPNQATLVFRVACAQANLASLKFHLPFSNLSLAVQRRFPSFSRPPFWPPFCRLALQTIRQTLVLFHLVIRCARLSCAAQHSTAHWSTVQRGAADEEAGTGRKMQVGTRSGRSTSAQDEGIDTGQGATGRMRRGAALSAAVRGTTHFFGL